MAEVIRPYRESDHEALRTFLAETFADLGRPFLPEGNHADVARINEVYLNGRGSFHVAEHDGVIVGSVGLRPFESTIGELKRLYVARRHRGVGLGRRLCETVLADAKAFGYRRVRLDSTRATVDAIALFRGLGFSEIPRYNDNPVAEIFMETAV